MKNIYLYFFVISATVLCSSVFANESIMKNITDNIVKVCDKPEDAGKYWDMKVKGDGAAELKLKLAEFGITGGAEFSKGEWQGVRTTIENNKNYRDCVKQLTPIFIEKFTPIIDVVKEPQTKPRVLGGVKWLEFGLGVEMTLDSCRRQASSVSCIFIVNAKDSDSQLYVYGSSAIYGGNGNKFNSNFVSIANFKSVLKNHRSYLIGELIKHVDTKVIIRFSDVSEDTKIISKAMVKTHIKSKGIADSYDFEFRNIKISI
ncbi:hypothetical protein MNBD_GAMMA20-877 [hydrothermal vent metagenome]|uniref:Uncharacterized protein n=1 Tax=hydrothermal vent metagenome TaxID=652676 RepID=A0A3B1BEV6_9ZZZZ